MAIESPVRTASITRELAAFCAEIRYAELPAEVRDRAKYLLLDWLGCALRGPP